MKRENTMEIAAVCLFLVLITACDLLQGPQGLPGIQGEDGAEGPQGLPGQLAYLEHVILASEVDHYGTDPNDYYMVTVYDDIFVADMWIDVWHETTGGSAHMRGVPRWDEAAGTWVDVVYVYDGFFLYRTPSSPAGKVIRIYYAPAESVS